MINIQVKRTVKLTIDPSILLRAVRLTLEKVESTSAVDISVVIGNDALLKKLNRVYRKINSTTDVLSFPSGEPDPDSQVIYLGDVVISLPKAQEQASIGGHSLADELQLLAVHGTLHLLGYDHEEPADKEKMQATQESILSQLGVIMINTL